MREPEVEDLHVFHTSAFQGLTIGIPFCIFKCLFGLLVVRHYFPMAGWLIIIWSLVDFLMNCTTILLIIFKLKPVIETCLLGQAGRLLHKPELFIAFDTFISFSIICFTLWSGWISNLRLHEKHLWLLATTINLVSLSLANIWGLWKKSPVGHIQGKEQR